MILKTEAEDFSRDTSSKALINNNIKALHQHKENKRKQSKMEEMESDISELKSDVSEVKALLKILISR